MTYPNIVVPATGSSVSRSGFGLPVQAAIQDLDDRVGAVEARVWSGVRKAVDTQRLSTISLSADPHLTIPIVATGTYIGRSVLYTTGDNAGDFRFRFVVGSAWDQMVWSQLRLGAASTTGIGQVVDYGGEPLGAATATSTIISAASAAVFAVMCDFTLTAGASSTNLTLEWAQGTSNANATTLKRGSNISLFRQD